MNTFKRLVTTKMDEPKEPVVTNEDLLDIGTKPKESTAGAGYFAMPKPSLGRLAGRASTFIGLANPKEKTPLTKDFNLEANDTDLIDLDSNEAKNEE